MVFNSGTFINVKISTRRTRVLTERGRDRKRGEPMEMEERKKKVLEAIIQDYIATAEPVGSRTISRKYNLGVSPATVRNEMADLEEMGLIEQPHTSAGRIPSQIGYRYYVDYLMEKQSVTNEVKKYIRSSLANQIQAQEKLVRGAVKLLSQITNYTAMLIVPAYSQNTLTHIQLLPLADNKLVLIMVLDNGHVEHEVLETPKSLSQDEAVELSAMLSEALCGLTVEQWKRTNLQSVRRHWHSRIELLQEIMDTIEDALTVEYEHKMYLSGALNIMNQPEFRNVDKVKGVLGLLEEQRIMEELMLKSGDPQRVSIRIGTENHYEDLSACSLVTATYQLDGQVIGTVGVLGPTRMEYSKTTGLLEYMSHLLTEGLKGK